MFQGRAHNERLFIGKKTDGQGFALHKYPYDRLLQGGKNSAI